MPSHSERPGIWLSVWRFLLTHCLNERAAEVLARLRGCAGSPEPLLLAYATSTKFAWRGPDDLQDLYKDNCLTSTSSIGEGNIINSNISRECLSSDSFEIHLVGSVWSRHWEFPWQPLVTLVTRQCPKQHRGGTSSVLVYIKCSWKDKYGKKLHLSVFDA